MPVSNPEHVFMDPEGQLHVYTWNPAGAVFDFLTALRGRGWQYLGLL